METPRRSPTRAKTTKRMRSQRAAASPSEDLPVRSSGVKPPAPRSPAPTEWVSFVVHCLRSWIAADAAGTSFFSLWQPRDLPALHPERAERARRRGSVAPRLGARRPPRRPRASSAAVFALSGPWGEVALRSRYPLVNALLAELAAAPNGRAANQRGG